MSGKRREFPRSVKVAVIKRATINGTVFCERCGNLAMRFEIDHNNPDGLGGEPTLSNAVLLCRPCHAEKTKRDVASIAKAKRREAAHVGATKPAGTLQSRNNLPKGKARRVPQLPMPPRRNVPEGKCW
jgi:5-methylcytosine-specific restriction protein A